MSSEEENDESKSKFLSFAVDRKLAVRIRDTAKADGLSGSSWVRSLIIRFFRQYDEEHPPPDAEQKPGDG